MGAEWSCGTVCVRVRVLCGSPSCVSACARCVSSLAIAEVASASELSVRAASEGEHRRARVLSCTAFGVFSLKEPRMADGSPAHSEVAATHRPRGRSARHRDVDAIQHRVGRRRIPVWDGDLVSALDTCHPSCPLSLLTRPLLPIKTEGSPPLRPVQHTLSHSLFLARPTPPATPRR